MGWSSGSSLMKEVIEILKMHIVDEDVRKAIYLELIPLFEDYDCDTLDECSDDDDLFEEALTELNDEHDFYDYADDDGDR